MTIHKCVQAKEIAEMKKDVQLSRERDILQTQEIHMLKVGIDKVEVKVDKLDAKMDRFIASADQIYVSKHEMNGLREKVENHQAIINRITWAIVL
jgi:hypothetical protein